MATSSSAPEQTQPGALEAPPAWGAPEPAADGVSRTARAAKLLEKVAGLRADGNSAAASQLLKEKVGYWAATELLCDMPPAEELLAVMQLLNTHPPDTQRAQRIRLRALVQRPCLSW